MTDPFTLRPRKWDNVLQKWRGLFWDEISDTQRELEINYQIEQNKKLLQEINSDRATHDDAGGTYSNAIGH